MTAIAESIIKGLDNLDNHTKMTDKICHKYHDMRIEIVLEHLRHLTNSSNRAADDCDHQSEKHLLEAIKQALCRYENPFEPHNKSGGFPRGELAWSMANDLKKGLDYHLTTHSSRAADDCDHQGAYVTTGGWHCPKCSD